MADIFDYMQWRDDLTFAQDPINEVDAVILARVSYLPFDNLMPEIASDGIRLQDAAEKILREPGIEESVLMKDDLRLLKALTQGRRYADLLVTDYVNLLEEQSQTQFSAMTICLDKKLHFVLYRGTDDTLIGWKENFNMAFTSPVAAQTLATEYLVRTAENVSGKLLVGGHSKGGNLAVYASSACGSRIQKRIARIYNFDGPGFADSVLKSPGYQAACGRVKTYVPQASVVGMLLGHEETYTAVHSSHIINLLQHDVYTWDVDRTHFVYLEEVTQGSKLIDATIKAWLSEVSIDQREKFVDAVYQILSETNVVYLREMSDNWFGSTVAIAKAIRSLDDETKKLVMKTMGILLKCTREELTDSMKNKTSARLKPKE